MDRSRPSIPQAPIPLTQQPLRQRHLLNLAMGEILRSLRQGRPQTYREALASARNSLSSSDCKPCGERVRSGEG